MFGIRSISFRFANVVGNKQTHGVGFDFLNKLNKNKSTLEILGNGKQSKSYVHISDLISGLLTAHKTSNSLNDVFNISTDDSINVNEIATMAIEAAGLDHRSVKLKYTGGDRGWRADVPIVRLSSSKLNSLGWKANFTSREAMKNALIAMYKELKR
jgi:UDP-glucose 4-epimerase